MPAIDLILDSGAFSAWKLGKSVDLVAYCDYLEANKYWIGTYINLDTINPDDPQASARQSFESYLYMRKRGLDPMVVFHAKEDFSWLQEMIASGASYIGLAALSLGSHTLRSAWYEHAWQYLASYEGDPITRVHALGEGRLEPLQSFPWYSADSTSWLYSSQRNGQIPLSDGRMVVQRNDGLNSANKPLMDALDPVSGEVFDRFLDQYKISRAVLARGGQQAHAIRTYLALQFYLQQERTVNKGYPKRFKPGGLFGKMHNGARPAVSVPQFKYYSVIGDNPIAWAVLGFAGGTRGLTSYYYMNAQRQRDNTKTFVFDPSPAAQITDAYARTYATLQEATGG